MSSILSEEACVASCLNNLFRRQLTDDEYNDYINRYFYSDDAEAEETGEDEEDADGQQAVEVEVETNTDTPLYQDELELIEIPGESSPLMVVEPLSPPSPELVSVDIEEERRRVEDFHCGCKKVVASGGIGCCHQFALDEILHCRWSFNEHTADVQDAFVMGSLLSLPYNVAEQTCGAKKKAQDRRRPRTNFFLLNRPVCRTMYRYLLPMGNSRLTALIDKSRRSPLSLRKDGRGGANDNIIKLEDKEKMIAFLNNCVEEEGIQLPGRIPGFKREDIQILPTHLSKAELHRRYELVCSTKGDRAVSLAAFKKIWQRYVPQIVVGRPKTDLCWTCQNNNTRIFRSAHTREAEKLQLLDEQRAHIEKAREERAFYKDCGKKTQMAMERVDLGMDPEPGFIHYSFDFAQQVHLPHNPLQPGPMYFLCPRKVGIFGVCCEALPKQTNYLIDEGMSSSKGSNMVISLLHHYFDFDGSICRRQLSLHCDYCSGQNKNRFMLFYLAWRVSVGLNSVIELHFMPAGHTKFAPDWCFGLLKRKFRLSEVNSLDELCAVVDSSTTRAINTAQVVGWENGESVVSIYNWQSFFVKCKPLVGIKSLSHFRFSRDAPGVVQYKERLQDDWAEFQLFPSCTWSDCMTLPDITPPPGLSRERAEYLHRQIRPFVRESDRDILCPEPAVS